MPTWVSTLIALPVYQLDFMCSKYNGLLVFGLHVVVLPLEEADVYLPKTPAYIQPYHLRVAEPVIFLREIGAVGILILPAAAEDIAKAQGSRQLIIEESLFDGDVGFIEGPDIALGSALRLHIGRPRLVAVVVDRQVCLRLIHAGDLDGKPGGEPEVGIQLAEPTPERRLGHAFRCFFR